MSQEQMEQTSPPEGGFSRFESELRVRPDDIDMNQHVHASRYLDYVLAARYDQMERCYGLSLESFHDLGLGWVMHDVQIRFKRPLYLGEDFVVATWVHSFSRTGVTVHFEILKKDTRKLASDGHCHYVLVNRQSGRAEKIPPWIAEKYSI